MQRPKILYIGDSLAHNVNLSKIEYDTKTRIKSTKAYSAVEDLKARFPHKNFTDVTSAALNKTRNDDKYTELILAAPTVDISNLNTEQLTGNENIEVYKQKIISSCHNMYSVAQNALIDHPELRKVVLMEHAPRRDTPDVDPTGLKSKLAIFANSSLTQLWHSSAMKDRISIGKHSLDLANERTNAVYKDDWTGRYDGVHMYGSCGKETYTKSVSHIIKSALPNPSSRSGQPSSVLNAGL